MFENDGQHFKTSILHHSFGGYFDKIDQTFEKNSEQLQSYNYGEALLHSI